MFRVSLIPSARSAEALPQGSSLWGPLVVAAVVLVAALFGILTRPIGFLAAFWPANAVLLGLMIRFPRLATPAGWLAAVVAFLVADLMTGSSLFKTAWLTSANLAGAISGYVVFQALIKDPAERRLRRPVALLKLLVVCAVMSLAEATVGCGTGPVLFGVELVRSFALWLCTEAVNSIIVLPVMLSIEPRENWRNTLRRAEDRGPWWRFLLPRDVPFAAPSASMDLSPLAALVASVAAMFWLGGPGAVAFPVPALLWCALRYNAFASTLLTMIVCVADMIALEAAHAGAPPFSPTFLPLIVSQRVGAALLSLAPLMVSATSAMRNELENALRHANEHDALTSALARSAFRARSHRLLHQLANSSAHAAVLMLDIDHFKLINDRHGHAAGDEALIAFADVTRGALRDTDLFGRLGGEEFAVLLPAVQASDAHAIAERLRADVEATTLHDGQGQDLRMTVTIGLAWTDDVSRHTLESLLAAADNALYQGKAGGRNRVVVDHQPAPPSVVMPLTSA